MADIDNRIKDLKDKQLKVHNYYYQFIDPKIQEGFWDKKIQAKNPANKEEGEKPKWLRKNVELTDICLCQLPDHMPSLDQMRYYDRDLKSLSNTIKYNLKFGDNIQKAYAIYQHSLKYNFEYLNSLQKLFLPLGLEV